MNEACDGSDGEAPGREAIAAVEAWRARGAASAQPVAFRIVEALARRAAAQQGEARRLMLERVAQLLRAHGAAGSVEAEPAQAAGTDESSARRAVLADLSAIVDRLGRAPTKPAAQRPNAVTAFKGTWSRLRADQRLRQAVSQVPAMAGPLNSSNVVNRTLQTMRDLSPEYLEAFMAHVDTLMWLERASGGGPSARASTISSTTRSR